MHIRRAKNVNVVKAVTLVSLINKVSEFVLKSSKQGGGVKKGLITINLISIKIFNFEAYKFFCNTEVFKTEVLEVVTKVRKNVCSLSIGKNK